MPNKVILRRYSNNQITFFIQAITCCWVISLFIVFNYLNGRNNYYLTFKWAKLAGELEDERDYKVAGLSRTRNRQFLKSQDWLLCVWSWILNGSLFVFSFAYNSLFFVIKFEDVSMVAYYLMQMVHVVHTTYFAFSFLPSLYMVSAFCASIMHLFSLKFNYISRHVKSLNSKRKPVDNRKLSTMIDHYTQVHIELIEMNKFFRAFNGFNEIYFFG